MIVNTPDVTPQPGDRKYSGTIYIRGPKSLHRKLSEMADEEGVSLNQLLVSVLSRMVGLNETGK